MNQFPQPAFITAVGHCLGEVPLDTGTKRTQRLAAARSGHGVERKHSLAADETQLTFYGEDLVETLDANRKPRHPHQRGGADAAIGRKEHRKQALSGTDRPRGNAARRNRGPCPRDTGLASPDSVLATAEDGLLAFRAQLTSARGGSLPKPLLSAPSV